MSVQIKVQLHELQLQIYPAICHQGRHFLICESLKSVICPSCLFSLYLERTYVAKKTFFEVFRFCQCMKCTDLKRILDMRQGDPFFRLRAVKKFPVIHIHIKIDINKCQPTNNKGCVDKITIKENNITVTRCMLNALRTLDNPYRLFPYCMLLLIVFFMLP